MIPRVLLFLRRLGRSYRRSEWVVRIFGLPVSDALPAAHGLILVQIDGFSRQQFHHALAKGRLPFLRRLLQKEHYVDHPFYSGLPSSTPATQGELLYGVKGCVPAFSFVDHESRELRVMNRSASAVALEKRLREKGTGLLEGGSCYGNVFTGGAAEPHYCAAQIGWNGLFETLKPPYFPLLLLFYADIVVRAAALLVVEFILAVTGFCRGVIAGRNFLKELEFIPLRVGICVLLRELITVGAKIDIARGLPIIHLNYLGYDEQAHHRGPSSSFAHWSLRGIDDCLARLWRAARRSTRREYDLWIYSDHGQESATLFESAGGTGLKDAVSRVFGQTVMMESAPAPEGPEIPKHAYMLGVGPQLVREIHPEISDIVVTAMGPIGNIYPPRALSDAEKKKAALELVRTHGIPAAFASTEKGVLAWTKEGQYRLPEDAAQIFGAHHPFLSEIGPDFAALCRSPDAGQIVVSGWLHGRKVYSFQDESGTHAGAGRHETAALCLLPSDAPVRTREPFIRPLDLRYAALRFLGRWREEVRAVPRAPSASLTEEKRVRFLTYNVHSCIGMDGKLSPDRIARVIARHRPDVVALQELDMLRHTSRRVNQAEEIADLLEMKYHFHPSFERDDGQFGNAVLSRYPMSPVRMDRLPSLRSSRWSEPRGALSVLLDVEGTPLQIVNTHLSIWPRERLLQADALCENWIQSAAAPLVLCGDFNTVAGTAEYRRIGRILRDVQTALSDHRPLKTWFGGYPLIRIDHIFVHPSIQIAGIHVPKTTLDRISSDHLPLVADLKLSPAQ